MEKEEFGKVHVKLHLCFKVLCALPPIDTILFEHDKVFWKSVPWCDEPKLERFGHVAFVWRKEEDAFDPKNAVPLIKHGDGGVMWGHFVASDSGNLHIVHRIMKKSYVMAF